MSTPKTSLKVIILMCSIAFLASCIALYPFNTVEAPTPSQDHTEQTSSHYDQNSWKTLIPEDCRSFSDGCNTCFKTENGEPACTKMYCEKYHKPYCNMTEENGIKNTENVPTCDAHDPFSQCKIFEEMIDQDREIISRKEAENLILAGEILQITQTHDLYLYLQNQEGKNRISKEPKIDAILETITICWDKCKNLIFATE